MNGFRGLHFFCVGLGWLVGWRLTLHYRQGYHANCDGVKGMDNILSGGTAGCPDMEAVVKGGGWVGQMEPGLIAPPQAEWAGCGRLVLSDWLAELAYHWLDKLYFSNSWFLKDGIKN